MAFKTKIEWCDSTWNPIVGCSVLSPGCTNCYAMRLAGTRLQHHPSRSGLTKPCRKTFEASDKPKARSRWPRRKFNQHHEETRS